MQQPLAIGGVGGLPAVVLFTIYSSHPSNYHSVPLLQEALHLQAVGTIHADSLNYALPVEQPKVSKVKAGYSR